MQAQQQAQVNSYAKKIDDNDSDLLFNQPPDRDDEEVDPLKRPVKPKKFNGLIEWVLAQEGHEFLIDVDRSFIKNKENLIGLKEKLSEEMS